MDRQFLRVSVSGQGDATCGQGDATPGHRVSSDHRVCSDAVSPTTTLTSLIRINTVYMCASTDPYAFTHPYTFTHPYAFTHVRTVRMCECVMGNNVHAWMHSMNICVCTQNVNTTMNEKLVLHNCAVHAHTYVRAHTHACMRDQVCDLNRRMHTLYRCTNCITMQEVAKQVCEVNFKCAEFACFEVYVKNAGPGPVSCAAREHVVRPRDIHANRC